MPGLHCGLSWAEREQDVLCALTTKHPWYAWCLCLLQSVDTLIAKQHTQTRIAHGKLHSRMACITTVEHVLQQ